LGAQGVVASKPGERRGGNHALPVLRRPGPRVAVPVSASHVAVRSDVPTQRRGRAAGSSRVSPRGGGRSPAGAPRHSARTLPSRTRRGPAGNGRGPAGIGRGPASRASRLNRGAVLLRTRLADNAGRYAPEGELEASHTQFSLRCSGRTLLASKRQAWTRYGWRTRMAVLPQRSLRPCAMPSINSFIALITNS